MKLLLYGGTFDPPHKGHLNLLKAAVEAVQPDRVVVMPAGIPPHKAASATPGSLRLKMCECFRSCHPQLEVCGWEIGQEGKSYTVNTLEMLEERFPGAELYLSVGSDMLTTFTGWKEWKKILKMATLVVQSRSPGDQPELDEAARGLEAFGGRIIFTQAPALPAASSSIRKGEAGDELLPSEVIDVARKYHLYGR